MHKKYQKIGCYKPLYPVYTGHKCSKATNVNRTHYKKQSCPHWMQSNKRIVLDGFYYLLWYRVACVQCGQGVKYAFETDQ